MLIHNNFRFSLPLYAEPLLLTLGLLSSCLELLDDLGGEPFQLQANSREELLHNGWPALLQDFLSGLQHCRLGLLALCLCREQQPLHCLFFAQIRLIQASQMFSQQPSCLSIEVQTTAMRA